MNSYSVTVKLSERDPKQPLPAHENHEADAEIPNRDPKQSHSKMRLDQYICSLQLEGLETRNQLKRQQVSVWKGETPLKFSHQVADGEKLLIRWQQTPDYDASCAVPMDLEILYEDAHLAVVNKPQGLAVHGAPSLREASLVQGLIAQYPDLLQNFAKQKDVHEFRPGIVHRLDKDTSGVLLVARNTQVLEALSEQFAKREVQKTYYAIVHGQPKQPKGSIELPLIRDPKAPQRYTVYKPQRLIGNFGGKLMNHEELEEFYREAAHEEFARKSLPSFSDRRPSKYPSKHSSGRASGQASEPTSSLINSMHKKKPNPRSARTDYQVLQTWTTNSRAEQGSKNKSPNEQFSLVRLRPSTGRTHQLRVHLKHLGCPVVGDPIYGKKQSGPSLMLHAFRLSFRHPKAVSSESAVITVQAPTPKHFRELLRSLIDRTA